MEKTEILAKLKSLIEEQGEIVISGNDDVLDIDSYMMMLIITFVGDEMGVQLDMDQLDFDTFKSLNILADLVASAGPVQGVSA